MLRRLVSEALASEMEIVDPADMRRDWRRVEFEVTLRRHPTYVIARTGRRNPAYVAGRPGQAAALHWDGDGGYWVNYLDRSEAPVMPRGGAASVRSRVASASALQKDFTSVAAELRAAGATASVVAELRRMWVTGGPWAYGFRDADARVAADAIESSPLAAQLFEGEWDTEEAYDETADGWAEVERDVFRVRLRR